MSGFVTRAVAVGFAVLGFAQSVQAKRIDITPADPAGYLAIEAAQDGDVVVIAPGTYHYRVNLTLASGQLIIRALDPNDWPVFDYTGQFASSWPGSSTSGFQFFRGCWRVFGKAQYAIYGIRIRGCFEDPASGRYTPAIWVSFGSSVTLRAMEVDNNQWGVMGSAENFVIEHIYIHDTLNQSLAVYGGQLTLRDNTVIGGNVNFLLEARNILAEYNWFARGRQYVGWIDGCEGQCGSSGLGNVNQTVVFRGNVFVSGVPTNSSQGIPIYNSLGPASDGTGNVTHVDLTWVNNTFQGHESGSTGTVFRLFNDTEGFTVRVDNSAFDRANRVIEFTAPATPNYAASGSNNWTLTGANVIYLSNSISSASPGFVDPAQQDFRPSVLSPLRGAAFASSAGLPDREYFFNGFSLAQYRARGTVSDVGAFEFGTSGPGIGFLFPALLADPVDEPPILSEPLNLGVGCGCSADGSSVVPGLTALLVTVWVATRRRRRSADAATGAIAR